MVVGEKWREVPQAGEWWRHFKGNLYKIYGLAKHTETGEFFVVYTAKADGSVLWCRPLEMFMSEVDRLKYPNAMQEYRFEKVSEQDSPAVSCEAESSSVSRHRGLCKELNELYAKKNHDYGDSFHASYLEEGLTMTRIRLGDKFSRFKTLSKGQGQEVKDESIRDTLIDLANYALMTVMELDRQTEEKG